MESLPILALQQNPNDPGSRFLPFLHWKPGFWPRLVFPAFLFFVVFPVPALSQDLAGATGLFFQQRLRMVEKISAIARETARETGRKAFSDKVTKAMAAVPRHEFVPADQRPVAYANRPLGIGYGQTISQPYIVALMTDLLDLEPDATVLEIGTGSGYQAAVLAELVRRVFTMEIIEPLGQQAKTRLKRLGYDNVRARVGDGYYGWKEYAPFDAIIVTAAASHIPPPLVRQLKPGGRMIIPVGERFYVQFLTLIEKDKAGLIKTKSVLPVSFVPLTGEH